MKDRYEIDLTDTFKPESISEIEPGNMQTYLLTLLALCRVRGGLFNGMVAHLAAFAGELRLKPVFHVVTACVAKDRE